MFLTAIMLYRHLANLSRGFKLIREKEKEKKREGTDFGSYSNSYYLCDL